MCALRAVASSEKRRTERSAADGQNNEGYATRDQRSHHHNGEPIGGFYKIQKGLDAWTRMPHGELLELVELFASHFCAVVQDGDGQRLENRQRSEKKQAAKGTQPRPRSASDRNSRAAAPREGNRKKSRAERRHKRIQTENRKTEGNSCGESSRL
jgi:hypothetical protein